jgi:hypothetical protein
LNRFQHLAFLTAPQFGLTGGTAVVVGIEDLPGAALAPSVVTFPLTKGDALTNNYMRPTATQSLLR